MQVPGFDKSTESLKSTNLIQMRKIQNPQLLLWIGNHEKF